MFNKILRPKITEEVVSRTIHTDGETYDVTDGDLSKLPERIRNIVDKNKDGRADLLDDPRTKKTLVKIGSSWKIQRNGDESVGDPSKPLSTLDDETRRRYSAYIFIAAILLAVLTAWLGYRY